MQILLYGFQSHTSPGSYHSQPSGGESGGTNPGGELDFPLAVEESSPPDMGVDSGTKEQVHVQYIVYILVNMYV